MITLRQFAWAVALLGALPDSAPADKVKALAALDEFEADFERDDKRPGKPVVSVRLGNNYLTLKELKTLTKHLSAFKHLRELQICIYKVHPGTLKQLAP